MLDPADRGRHASSGCRLPEGRNTPAAWPYTLVGDVQPPEASTMGVPNRGVGVVVALAVSLFAATASARETPPGQAAPSLAPPAVPPGLAGGDEDVDRRVGELVGLFARKGPFSGIVVVARGG